MATSHAIIVLHTALDTVKSQHDEILKNIEKMKKMILAEEERLAKLAKKMQEIQEALAKIEAQESVQNQESSNDSQG